jgi:hypothetical protein
MVESPNEETILNALMYGVNTYETLMAELAKSSKIGTLR